MTTAPQGASGGWFSKIVVVLLLALAIGLYLRIVMVDGERTHSEPALQANLRVEEGAAPATAKTELVELPADQMLVIQEVFAPETLQKQ